MCAVMLDTKGPEIRTGFLENEEPIRLVAGDEVTITTDYETKGRPGLIAMSYKKLAHDVAPGSQILCADGSIVLEVISTDVAAGTVQARCLNNATLGECKNVNLPGVVVDLPTLTEKDEGDLRDWGVPNNIDFVAASFVRKGTDLDLIRGVLGPKGAGIKIISKVENQEGLQNFDDILEKSDAIMVARGDLGMEIPTEKIFLAQKMMIQKVRRVWKELFFFFLSRSLPASEFSKKKTKTHPLFPFLQPPPPPPNTPTKQQCNMAGKPVITATQMLESMCKNPRPTRAEATDVANAVLDGTDCVMLSGETAAGAFPVEAVKVMTKICRESEVRGSFEFFFFFLFSGGREVEVERASRKKKLKKKIFFSLQPLLLLSLSLSPLPGESRLLWPLPRHRPQGPQPDVPARVPGLLGSAHRAQGARLSDRGPDERRVDGEAGCQIPPFDPGADRGRARSHHGRADVEVLE